MSKYLIAPVLAALVCVAHTAFAQDDKSGPPAFPLAVGLHDTARLCDATVRANDQEEQKLVYEGKIGFTVEDLVADYQHYDRWARLQDRLARLLATGGCGMDDAPTEAKPLLVTLLYSGEAYSVVVPQKRAYSVTLKGVRPVGVVVLMEKELADRVLPGNRAVLMSTKQQNPIVAQIPGFVKALADAAGAALPPPPPPNVRGAARSEPRDVLIGNNIYGLTSGRRVTLPFDRAAIVETVTVNTQGTDNKVAKVTATPKFTNQPLTTFTLMTGAGAFVGKLTGPERMKVDNGKYASDPLKRVMTIAALAYHPVKFEGGQQSIQKGEVLSFFAGGILTPTAGVGVGISIGIVKGLAANLGYGWMWVPTSSNGGPVKSEAPAANQLSYKANGGIFLGGGYVFGTK